MVAIGAALTTTMRRTPVACIAWTMARVPCDAMPVSDVDRGPRPDSTASAPVTADSSTAGSAAARSAVTIRTASPASLFGSRTTAVTSWPAARACSRTCRPIPPVAAKIVSFIGCSLLLLFVPEGGGVVGDPLGIGAHGAAEDPLHLAGDRRRLPDLPGVPGHQRLDEGLGNPLLDHALLGHLRRELLVAQRPAEHLTDRGDQLLVGERLRAGQLPPSAPAGHQRVAAQRVGDDLGQVPFMDQRLGEAGVGVADDVTGAELGAHVRRVLAAKELARRLTHARPLATAASSTSLFLSPLYREGCWSRGSSTLVADRATTRRTPRSWASPSSSPAASPTARGCRNRAVTPSRKGAIVSGCDRSPSTTSTSAGRPAACGLWVMARTLAPWLRRASMRGRPMVPVAPVTKSMTSPSLVRGPLAQLSCLRYIRRYGKHRIVIRSQQRTWK